MINKIKFDIFFITIFTITGYLNAFDNPIENKENQYFTCTIHIDKGSFYPGEPVLLNITFKNKMNDETRILLGDDGYGAFSIEVYDINDKLIEKSKKFERKLEGVGEIQIRSMGLLEIPPEGTFIHKIVLNALCSTKLPVGKYHIICNIEPLYLPWKPGDLSQPHIPVELPLISKQFDIEITKQGKANIEKIIQNISKQAFLKDVKDLNSMPKIENRRIAREMLSFTESEFAIPYQLKLLEIADDGWMMRDTINSLAKSGSLEAAKGLVQLLENKSIYIEGLQQDIINAVYKLRETKKLEIIEATKKFAEKYKPIGIPYFEVD